eukprot:Phypoly_transcript_02662.p1 GENE.Phypoly_transcript_02662~~Phypoly_transcript_02662.p1  ORF type:complete len:822 (-),score=149.61 Phypoly_transcript_02662:108-2573(-)
MESQDSSQETQPEVPQPDLPGRPSRDLLAQLIPLHPTADYVDVMTVPFSFGRLKTSNFVINDKRISATHCILTKKQAQIYIEDKSTNGTYINQRVLGKGKSMKLNTGDIVAFVEKDGYGTFSYVFYDVCAPPSTSEKVLKEYAVECVLGNGNFGVVQRVKRVSSGESFAMKVIDKMKLAASYNKMDENNTLMEVHILKILRHPNIISVVEVCDTPRYVYLILELANQGELFEKIFNQGCYSEREGKQVFRQILDAIAYLHDNKIAHRDLKPENILLHNNNGETVVKVSDFGLAKILGEFQSTRTLCGTPMYVAPEMLAHSRFLQGDKTVAPEAKNGYGIEVDAWSLGCILYIILSGRPPFNDPIPKDLFERIAAGDYEMTEDPWQRISSDAKDLISKLLVVDPAKRLTVRGALTHKWFAEVSSVPLYSDASKPKTDRSSRPDKTDKYAKSGKTDDKLDKHNKSDKLDKSYKAENHDKIDDSPQKREDSFDPPLHKRDDSFDPPKNLNENESYRTSLKPQSRQNSENRENIENMKLSNDRLNTPETDKTKERNEDPNDEMDRDSEGDVSKNTKRSNFVFKEPIRDKTEKRTEETKRSSERAPHDGSVVKTMDRPQRSSRDPAESNAVRTESRTESRTSTDRSHRHKPMSEIDPIVFSKEPSKSPRHPSKDGKKETKSVHSVFALPTTPSTKISPHKSPKKSSPITRGINTRRLEFTHSPTQEKLPSKEAKTSAQKDLPVVGYIDKASKDKHSSSSSSSSKRFSLSSQSRKLDFLHKPRTESLLTGSGSGDDEAKKRKLIKGDDCVVIDDDESRRTGKKQKEH